MEEKKLDLGEIRTRINAVDDQLKKLLLERLDLVSEVAEYKKSVGMPVHDRARERQIIANMTRGEDEETANYITMFYTNLFDIAKAREVINISGDEPDPLSEAIQGALADTPPTMPKSAAVACQGVEGAYSQLAAQKLFARPEITYHASFGDVLNSVVSGECRYGVIPIENSIAGSVSGVYEMIAEHECHIVRGLRLHISHALLAKPGTKLSDIRQIYSHQQAIGQCSRFLSTLSDVEIIPVSNTAVAAGKVAGADGNTSAAICSPECRDLYGLDYVSGAPQMVADNGNNHTRFVCVSRNLEIYPGADKITMLCSLQHKPGALYSMIAEFAAAGINLTKLESRPIPGCDFEYHFIFEFQASVYSPHEIAVVSDISRRYDAKFLGAYSEII